jgi:hypothetical protein
MPGADIGLRDSFDKRVPQYKFTSSENIRVIKSQAKSQFFAQGACEPFHSSVVVSAVVLVRALIAFFAGVLIMENHRSHCHSLALGCS